MDKKAEMFKLKNSRFMENVCFIDPGLGGTGFAFFPHIVTAATSGKNSLVPPRITANYKGGAKESWEAQVCTITSACCGAWVAAGAQTVVIEFPRLFTGNSVSMASAKKGDLFKLTYLVGALGFAAKQITGNLAVLVEPQEWKGQLPKDVMAARMAKVWPDLHIISSHAADACGMGLAAQGGL